MKFQDIKQGDVVYIQQGVRIGWKRSIDFFIPKKVVRVTAARFEIEGGDIFNKETGRGYGKTNFSAYNLGDKSFGFLDKVTDQSVEMAEFIEKQKIASKIEKQIQKFKISSELPMTLNDLKEVKKVFDWAFEKLGIG